MAVGTNTRSDWAKLGARTRLMEIDQERSAILKAFPELKGTRASTSGSAGSSQRKISAAARRAMSAGMRKYWARRKSLAAKAQGAKAQAK